MASTTRNFSTTPGSPLEEEMAYEANYETDTSTLNTLYNVANKLRSTGLTNDTDFDPPIAVLVGQQSAGKSSMLWRLTGLEVPRASGQCTRNPHEIRCKNPREDENGFVGFRVMVRIEFDENGAPISPVRETFIGEAEEGDSHMFGQIYQRGLDQILKNGVLFSLNVIVIEYYNPRVLPVIILDLPGWIVHSKDGENHAKMCQAIYKRYLGLDNASYILCHCAQDDVENNVVWKQLVTNNKLDKTMCIFTKPDLVGRGDYDRVMEIFDAHDLKPKKGVFVVGNPNTQDVKDKTYDASPESFDKVEYKGFIQDGWKPYYKRDPERFTFANARKHILTDISHQYEMLVPEWTTLCHSIIHDKELELDALLEGQSGKEPQLEVIELYNDLNKHYQNLSDPSTNTNYFKTCEVKTMDQATLITGSYRDVCDIVKSTKPIFSLHKDVCNAPAYGWNDVKEIDGPAIGHNLGINVPEHAFIELKDQVFQKRRPQFRKLFKEVLEGIRKICTTVNKYHLEKYPTYHHRVDDVVQKLLRDTAITMRQEYEAVLKLHDTRKFADNERIKNYALYYESLLFGKNQTLNTKYHGRGYENLLEGYGNHDDIDAETILMENQDGLFAAIEALKYNGERRAQVEDLYIAGQKSWGPTTSPQLFKVLHEYYEEWGAVPEENYYLELDVIESNLKQLFRRQQRQQKRSIKKDPSAQAPRGQRKRSKHASRPPTKEVTNVTTHNEFEEDPAEDAATPGWREVEDGTGRKYFWNKNTDETTWTEPEEITRKKSEQVQKKKKAAAPPEPEVEAQNYEQDLVTQNIWKPSAYSMHSGPHLTEQPYNSNCVGIKTLFNNINVPKDSVAVLSSFANFFPEVTLTESGTAPFEQVIFPKFTGRHSDEILIGRFIAQYCAYQDHCDNYLVNQLVDVITKNLNTELPDAIKNAIMFDVVKGMNDESARELLQKDPATTRRIQRLEFEIAAAKECRNRLNKTGYRIEEEDEFGSSPSTI